MGPIEELEKSLKDLNKFKLGLLPGKDIKERVTFLKKKIEGLAKDGNQGLKESSRLELLQDLLLFCELSSAIDFEEMITAREKFQELLPNHFEAYLSYLKESSWQISWSGCLDCRHFSGRCNLNLTPVDAHRPDNPLEKTCPSYVKRSSKV